MKGVCCFSPEVSPEAKTLVLGSMPGKKSLHTQQYYAHPSNSFWRIMSDLLGFGENLSYEQRLAYLRQANIGLWDVLASCERESSLDADIKNETIVVNNFVSFFRENPYVKKIFFNGAKAEKIFHTHVLSTLQPDLNLQLIRLPSTSPAHASLSYEGKLLAWKKLTI